MGVVFILGTLGMGATLIHAIPLNDLSIVPSKPHREAGEPPLQQHESVCESHLIATPMQKNEGMGSQLLNQLLSRLISQILGLQFLYSPLSAAGLSAASTLISTQDKQVDWDSNFNIGGGNEDSARLMAQALYDGQVVPVEASDTGCGIFRRLESHQSDRYWATPEFCGKILAVQPELFASPCFANQIITPKKMAHAALTLRLDYHMAPVVRPSCTLDHTRVNVMVDLQTPRALLLAQSKWTWDVMLQFMSGMHSVGKDVVMHMYMQDARAVVEIQNGTWMEMDNLPHGTIEWHVAEPASKSSHCIISGDVILPSPGNLSLALALLSPALKIYNPGLRQPLKVFPSDWIAISSEAGVVRVNVSSIVQRMLHQLNAMGMSW